MLGEWRKQVGRFVECAGLDERMRVTAEYAAQVKRAAGVGAETLDVDASCTVEQLVQAVAARHGDALRALLLTGDGRLHPSILVFLRGEQVRDGSTPLRDGDTVTLLPPISGG